MPVYHIDAYRLEGITQDLGFEEYFEDDGVCVIECRNLLKFSFQGAISTSILPE